MNPQIFASVVAFGIGSVIGTGNASAADTTDHGQQSLPLRSNNGSHQYSVGGIVKGLLAGNTVTLQNNGIERVQVSGNGAFVFSKRLQPGAAYSVITAIRPNGQTCVVEPSTSTGTIANANITSVAVDCGGISVRSNRLTRGGKTWIPKGLSMLGALTCKRQVQEAKAHWGDAELAAAKAWGADTLRFQVSQPVLDPDDVGANYDKAKYLNELRVLVAKANARGFAVILSMQDQVFACGDATQFPTQASVRAWNVLAPIFAHNTKVIYELYNEPQGQAPRDWNTWRNGGGTTADGQSIVGLQQLLDLIRKTHKSDNVILADGLQYAEVLTGVQNYLLNDSRNLTGYAVHPYYMLPPGFDRSPDPERTARDWWEARFGFLAATKPVVASEWNANSGKGGCHAQDPVLAELLLPYLRERGIGVYGWAFDLPGTLIKTEPTSAWTWTPTDFSQWVCGSGDNGAGKLLRDYYLDDMP